MRGSVRGASQPARRGLRLIFMGSRGAHGLEALLAGSQTQKVLQNTELPVMVSIASTRVPLRYGGCQRF
jgi:hypothetical protein